MSLQLAATSYIYMRKLRLWWQRQTVHRQRSVQRLQFVGRLDISALSVLYKNFTRLCHSEIEFLINLIGEKSRKKGTEFRKDISVQEGSAPTLRLLASAGLACSSFPKLSVSSHAPSFLILLKCLKTNAVALVRERTKPTEQPPPVGEVSANFCG
jgi:hypothetical protein